MAIKTFKLGKVQVDSNDVAEVNSAALNITFDLGETTELGDTWKEQLSLGKSWNLSMTANYNPNDTAQAALRTEFISGDGALADVRMYEDNSIYFSGAGVITAFNVTKNINAIDTVSITIEGNGALSYSG